MKPIKSGWFVYAHRLKGLLIYVGCGRFYRMRSYWDRNRHWMHVVGEKQIEIEVIRHFRSRAPALKYERRMISELLPLTNVVGHPTNKKWMDA